MQSLNSPLVAKGYHEPGRFSGHVMPPDTDGPCPTLRDGDSEFTEMTLKLMLREITSPKPPARGIPMT